MIARIWRGRTKKENADVYWKFLTHNAEDDCRHTKGNHGVSVCKRIMGDYAEFVFISFWESLEAVKTYAGDDIDKAHYFPEDLKYVIDPSTHVEHYEVFSV
ncbi:MAG TPA: antibiotic biosynthesis monooxygenase [Acidobacteriota bacterium]|jgi:heme-degrading monooxygenase HmoA